MKDIVFNSGARCLLPLINTRLSLKKVLHFIMLWLITGCSHNDTKKKVKIRGIKK